MHRLIPALVALTAATTFAADSIVEERRLLDHVFSLTRNYLDAFQHPETGILYGARLKGKDNWTSPADVLQEKPKPWGYGSRIADTALHTGHMLVALLDAHEARPDPLLKELIRRHFEAIKLIGSLPEKHPKPGKPDLVGLVPRGPHPDDPAAYFDDSSMDQHTTYIISLAIYANSSLATKEDQAWIRDSLGKVGRRLEKHNWSIMRADGVTQAHVGFSWKGYNSNHASILLPAVLALYKGTGDQHWLDAYEQFMTEDNGKRWQQVHPGPHVRINGHPIYANQNAFRVQAWYHFENDPARRKVIGELLEQSVQMQLDRDFPGEFYRKYHSKDAWQTLAQKYEWNDTDLRGASMAWNKFQPDMLDQDNKGLAALAHIRFPLGGFHMALLSEHPELIRSHLPAVWKMLSSVELEKVEAGETHYLFTVVALHLYAHYFRNPEWFTSANLEQQLPIIGDAGTGPVIDVAVEGNHAYAIGKSKLHVLDLANPAKPRPVGSLSGLGSVRQIEVSEAIAYVTSRQDGLFIVDVSAPTAPRLLNHYNTIEFATGVALSGDILFVACRHYGVELIDVSDPEHPSHISFVRTGEAQSVVARNGMLYAGVWASSEVVTVDVRDPWNPKIISRVALDGYGDGVDVEGDYLFVATGHHSKQRPRREPGDPGFGRGHGLEIFDIQDPANPKYISRVKFPPLYEIGNDMWGVTATSNGYAFVADTYNGAFVVDVQNPAAPRIIGRCQLPFVEARNQQGFVGGLAVVKDHLYLAGGFTDLHTIGVPEIATLPVPEPDTAPVIGPRPLQDNHPRWRQYQPGGQVHAVDFLSDGRAVVACGSEGVQVLELWPEVRNLSKLKTKGFATDLSVSGDRVYIAESAGGLSVCELVPDGHQLKRLGRFEIPGRAIRQVETPEVEDRILIQAGANQFLVLDVGDPTNIKPILEDKRHGLLYGDQMMRGLVEDRYTCVFWHVSGLHWYDLKSHPAPTFSGNNYPERIGSSNGLIAFGDQTLAMVRGGYVLLDRKEKRPISDLSVQRIGKQRIHLGVPTVAGDRLYSANRAYGLVSIVDISNPQAPILIDQFESPGNPCRIAIYKGIAVIPNGYHGLLILDQQE